MVEWSEGRVNGKGMERESGCGALSERVLGLGCHGKSEREGVRDGQWEREHGLGDWLAEAVCNDVVRCSSLDSSTRTGVLGEVEGMEWTLLPPGCLTEGQQEEKKG